MVRFLQSALKKAALAYKERRLSPSPVEWLRLLCRYRAELNLAPTDGTAGRQSVRIPSASTAKVRETVVDRTGLETVIAEHRPRIIVELGATTRESPIIAPAERMAPEAMVYVVGTGLGAAGHADQVCILDFPAGVALQYFADGTVDLLFTRAEVPAGWAAKLRAGGRVVLLPRTDAPIAAGASSQPVVAVTEALGACEDLPRVGPERDDPTTRVRIIAFYLPQYHRIAENDAWWGHGFTDWRKVASARPLFVGHYQPHLPADTGFYDLRLPETRLEQAVLARAYGVDAFCYWHYWFEGRRLLERPFDAVLTSGEPDFPFCLCWANENWTRRWDGHDDQVLLAQGYSAADDRRHLAYLARAFRDPRYVRVDDRPLFLIYRAGRLPDPAGTAGRLRDEAWRLGLGELFLCRVESFPDERGDPAALGFDAAVEFQPDWSLLSNDLRTGPVRAFGANGEIGGVTPAFNGNAVFGVYDYEAVAERMAGKAAGPYLRFPCVLPGWDNSPRRGRIDNSVILHGSTPAAYERWLLSAVAHAHTHPGPPLVFINAWNEWAEGSHLEPDLRHGKAYLEATQRAVGLGTSHPLLPTS